MRIRNRPQTGFSTLLLTRFLALTVVSVVAVGYFGAHALGKRLREDAAEHLQEAALRVCEGLEHYLDLHRRAIVGLTETIRPAAAGELQVEEAVRALGIAQRTYPGFLTLLVADREGRIVVASRRREESAALPGGAGRRVEDREYFRMARDTGRPYISGIFRGRGLGSDPIVAISAPIVDSAGRFRGVIEGSIDVARLPLDADGVANRPMVVAQDGDGRVVYSTHAGLHRALEEWEPEVMGEASTELPFLLADPAQRDEEGKLIPLYSVRYPIPMAGWQVTAALPVATIEANANLFFRQAGMVLLVVILLAWATARVVARSIARPIVELAEAMRELRLEKGSVWRQMPAGAAREIGQIHEEFNQLAERLGESFRALRNAVDERDRTNGQLQELLGGLDRKVAETETRYRQVVESSGDIIIRTDAFGRITFHNAAFALFVSGDGKADCRGRSLFSIMDAGCRERIRARALRQIRERESSVYLEYSITDAGGATRWIGQSTQLLLDGTRFPAGFQAIARDVTERKVAELALQEAQERYTLAVQGSNNGIWDWDLRTGEVYYSPRWRQIFGLAAGAGAGEISTWFERIHPEDAAALRSMIRSYIEEGSELFEAEHRMRHEDGTWRWILVCGAAVRGADGKALRIAGSKSDITAGKLADPLTGLPNRLALLEVMESWNDRLREDATRRFAILFLDLDRFKLINDSLGHVKGDHLLLGVSHRLLAALQSMSNVDGLVARMGGDEFVILVDTTRAPEAPVQLAKAVTAAMEPAFHLDGSLVFVSTSIGIACSRTAADVPESLLRDADTAMYHAKSAGRGRYAEFDSSMHARAVARLGMETDLRRAVEEREFVLYFQPQVDLRNGRLAGFEALVRWQHPQRGLLPPSDFIPVAEENGVILPLGRWVLEEGCRQLAAWDQTHPACRRLSMSINLSARQFTDPTLAGEVGRILKETGLKPQRLHLEVTESMLADDPLVAQEILKELSTMGVVLEVDDFGTGYSCLGQLNRLPFDTLKIDRSFVRALDMERDGHKMIDSIASLAGSLGISVVAEGVETAAHWSYLMRLGCQLGQGYYFSKAVNGEEALRMLEFREETPWPMPDAPSLDGLREFAESREGTQELSGGLQAG
jgi:diguanylate cyclase (GGDEF)-like protein/PAS domain S-box-containing protein